MNKILNLTFILCFIFLQSCADDLLDGGLNYEEGKATTISLNVKIPEMTVLTRGEMSPGSDTELSMLWVGIFSQKTGKCTYAHYYDVSRLHTNHGDFYNLGSIDTESGNSYIVAVGNPNENYCYDSQGKRMHLTDVLPESKDKAGDFTWSRYNSLAVSQLSLGRIDTPVGHLLMSGIYTAYRDNTNHSAYAWEDANFSPVMIPVSQPGTPIEMDGAIHLRRLISQVKFHIAVGNNPDKGNRRIVNVTPESYRVYNVPFISNLHEQKSQTPTTNAGDNLQVEGVEYTSDSFLPNKANYTVSSLFNGKQYFTGTTDGGYEFDFWMLENKRRSVVELPSGDEGYRRRELERKTDAGIQDDNNKNLESNTGIYTALCGETGPETMNNCATFVEIRCNLEYTDTGLDDLNQGNTSNPVIKRTASVVYTVHLGGINGDWNDFAHRRNHKYTYNVTVVDLDKIILEAEQDNETAPGAEGVVTDVTNPTFELDAHYSVFNIHITDNERTGAPSGYKDGMFPFRLEVYDGKSNRLIIDQENYKNFKEYYWNWVEFRPTTAENVLSEYKPYAGTNSDGRTFRLNEIGAPDNNSLKGRSASGWYTVFINEYTYETELDEGKNNWVDYVNKPNRVCWLQTQSAVSKDQESIYIKSKYCFTQRSIQSFYDMPDDRNVNMDAIGMEHENEIWGLNLRWNNAGNNMTLNNGRHNQITYLGYGKRWTQYYNPTRLQYINNINTNSYQYDRTLGLKQGPYYVPAIVTSVLQYEGGDTRYNINTTDVVTILNACMNRNRDNNGDGIISIDEVRWYVPASSEIVDLVLGRKSLQTALMDYDANPSLNTPRSPKNPPHHVNTRFHYATSNNRKLWSEEGVTVTTARSINDWDMPPWDVRCVRALGTNLATDNVNDLSPAFTVDDPQNPSKIYPTYYEEKNKRGYTPSVLQPHKETDDQNRICENGFEFTKKMFGNFNWWSIGGNYEYHYIQRDLENLDTHDKKMIDANAICQQYGSGRNETGWRLPNIKEAALIKLALNHAGIFATNNDYDIRNFLSCTYREYGINSGQETSDNHTGYYLGVVYDGTDNAGNGDIGRVQCITEYNQQNNSPLYYIRCVRDIR